MRPAAAFYHVKISGEGIPNTEFAELVMANQMVMINKSGLADHCQEIRIGVNGTESDSLTVGSFCPSKSILITHGTAASSEIPTMNLIERWLPQHPGWNVLYFHTKGVSHPHDPLNNSWRGRMERNCLENWKQCVDDLESGFDAVGCHWLTPEHYPGMVSSPFFGGTFWWARSEYLSHLPPLPPDSFQNRYEAESWIGRRRPYPGIRDYHPGWPGI